MALSVHRLGDISSSGREGDIEIYFEFDSPLGLQK